MESTYEIIVGLRTTDKKHTTTNSAAIDLSNFYDWEDVEEELRNKGFDLNDKNKELFVEDYGFLPDQSNIELTPQELFELLDEAGVMEDSDKEDCMEMFIEARSWREFSERVSRYGRRWNDEIYFHPASDLEELGQRLYAEGYIFWDNLPKECFKYIDWEKVGKEYSYEMERVSGGWLEVR